MRFKRLGFPALYANWAHLSLFSSGIIANPRDEDFERQVLSIGAQANVKLVIFSSLASTLSLGHAVALEEGWPPERELMISLNILH